MNANPELLVLPLVLPEQRRTRDPLPETLVRQFLRRRPQMDLLRELRAVLKPYPERPPWAAPQKPYEPPSRGRYKRRR